MKKWISVALATFCTVSFVEAATLEEFNKYISEAKNPTNKQMLTCEREASFIAKDPQQCIKAVDMLLEMSKKITKNSLLRCEYYGANEKEDCKLLFQNAYQKTDKEFFDETIAYAYCGAGIVYDKSLLYKDGVDMYKKAVEYHPNNYFAHTNLGNDYYHGEGVAMNKIKAYYHWSIAAKQGNQVAQKNLDALCSESPWACKK